VLLAASMLTGCGGKPEGCVTLAPDVAQAIVNGAKGDLRISANTGRAIKADSGVYYAAYRITAAGSDETGVWALSEISPPGSIRAVDGFAQQFTTWPVPPGANGSATASAATACLD
jgi:hypothetical protein